MPTRKIPPSEAKVGMILASPIADQQGRTIMGEGTRLTPVHVKRLDRWGVAELIIEVAEDGETPVEEIKPEPNVNEGAAQIDQDYMRECAAAFKERFQPVDGQPLMESLKKAAFKLVVLAGRNGLPGVRVKA